MSPHQVQPVDAFRGNPRDRLPLHPLEWTILVLVCLHLCFLPWALGTMHSWSQLTSLSLAGAGFLLALCPRTYRGAYTPGPDFQLRPWSRLVRWPVFWIGLGFLAYVAAQGLNPSWVWERSERFWWLRRVNDIEWLPTSIDTPFERFNLWRQLIIYCSAWLTVSTIWVGFTRRRSLHIVLTVAGLNGVALSASGFLGRFYLPNWEWVLWIEQRLPGATSFARFIYKNHAGAYLALTTAIAVALAAWHHEKGLRHLARSTPGMLWLVASVAMTFGVVFTYARGATLLLAAFLVLSLVVYLVLRLASPVRSTTSPLVWVLIIALVGGTAGYAASQLNYGRAARSYSSLFDRPERDLSVTQRLDAYRAARQMLADHWGRGVGSGGFRFLFPEYIQRFPSSYHEGRLFWEHAHCDWLQLPIELGAGGIALLALAAGWCARELVRRRPWRHPGIVLLALGCLQPPAQAVFDFPFQNPAILITWLSLVTLLLRWLEWESGKQFAPLEP